MKMPKEVYYHWVNLLIIFFSSPKVSSSWSKDAPSHCELWCRETCGSVKVHQEQLSNALLTQRIWQQYANLMFIKLILVQMDLLKLRWLRSVPWTELSGFATIITTAAATAQREGMEVVAELLRAGVCTPPAFYGWEEELIANWLKRQTIRRPSSSNVHYLSSPGLKCWHFSQHPAYLHGNNNSGSSHLK